MNVDQHGDWRVPIKRRCLNWIQPNWPSGSSRLTKPSTRDGLREDNLVPAEQQALADALANLRVLRREVGLPMTNTRGKVAGILPFEQ